MPQFLNPGFEVAIGDLNFGWTITSSRFITGQNFTIGALTYTGASSPLDQTYPASNNTLADDDAASMTFNSVLSNNATVGARSLELSSSGTSFGYGVVRGPWVYSSDFTATAGQTLTFDWKAEGGGDAFDVFGFLISATDVTFASIVVLDETGSSPINNTSAYGSGGNPP